MDNFNQIDQIVRAEFEGGTSKEELFRNILSERGFDPPPVSTVCDWISRMHTQELRGEMGTLRHSILCTIVGRHLKFKHAIFYRQVGEPYSTELMLSDRTLLVVHKGSDSFTLFDTFNEESRNHRFGSQQSTVFSSRVVLVDKGRILVSVFKENSYYLRLLKIDVESIFWPVLNEIECSFHPYKILLDSYDDTKFALLGRMNKLLFMHKGQLIGDKLHIEEQQIEFGTRLWQCKLEGDKLSAFRLEQTEERFCEYDLSSIAARKVNDWPIPSCYCCLRLHIHFAYIWSNNKLYVSCDSWTTSPFTVVVFDSETRKWTKTNFTGMGKATELQIDDDYILTVSTIEDFGDNSIKTTYRFPMRKPDKSRYLLWATIRRGAMFFGSDIYEKLLPNLPYSSEFRSFTHYY